MCTTDPTVQNFEQEHVESLKEELKDLLTKDDLGKKYTDAELDLELKTVTERVNVRRASGIQWAKRNKRYPDIEIKLMDPESPEAYFLVAANLTKHQSQSPTEQTLNKFDIFKREYNQTISDFDYNNFEFEPINQFATKFVSIINRFQDKNKKLPDEINYKFDLSFAVFGETNMQGIDLTDAKLNFANFYKDSRKCSNFTNTSCIGAKFDKCYFSLLERYAKGSRLFYKYLEQPDRNKSISFGSSFKNADLRFSSFWESCCEDSDFDSTNMRNFIICNSFFDFSKFTNACLQNDIQISHGFSSFRYCDFLNTDLKMMMFYHGKFNYATFKNCNIVTVFFYYADMLHCHGIDSRVINSNFTNTHIKLNPYYWETSIFSDDCVFNE